MDRLKRLIGRLKRSSKDEDSEKATREQAEKELREKLQKKARKKLRYGYVWNVKDEDSKEAIASVFSDIDELVEKIVDITIKNIKTLKLNLSNTREQVIETFEEDLEKFIEKLDMNTTHFFTEYENSKSIEIPITSICAMRAKIKNSEVTEREFGKKPNGEEYTAEEIKALVGKAYVASRKKEFVGKRTNRAVLTSIIIDMDDANVVDVKDVKNSVIRFIKLDIDKPDKTIENDFFTKLMKICKEAQINGIKKIIVPYFAYGHSVTLIIDVDGFLGGKEGSITCFDSSLHFTEEVEDTEKGKIRYFKEKMFPTKIYKLLEKKPINETKLQKKGEKTCTFHTEAVVIILDSYIRVVEILQAENNQVPITDIFKSLNLDPDIESCIENYIKRKKQKIDLSLKSIRKFLNDKEVVKLIKAKEEEYYLQFTKELKIETTPTTKLPTINDASELQTNEEDVTNFDDNENLGLKSQDDTKPIDQSPNPSTPAEQDQQQDTSTPQQPGEPLVHIGQLSEDTLKCIEEKEEEMVQQQPNQKTTAVCYNNK